MEMYSNVEIKYNFFFFKTAIGLTMEVPMNAIKQQVSFIFFY